MAEHNIELARIFHDISAIYQYLGGNERFRALAYQKASRVIGGLQADVSDFEKSNSLEEIPGIGESIAEKIREYLRTGKIQKYETLIKKVPHELLGLMDVRGFGARSLKTLHDKLRVKTKEELIESLASGKVSKLKGFGDKKVQLMLRGLKLHKAVEERMLLWDAMQLCESIIREMKSVPGVIRIGEAGSLRRKKETIGDIDILICCAPKNRKKIVNKFTLLKGRKEILAKGETRASITLGPERKQTDLRIVNESQWGSALQYFTGSKEHNVHLRTIARDKGYKINEYGLFRIKDGKWVAGKTEEDIYEKLGFRWMPPEMREDQGEIELAAKHKIPDLVELKDIRGDLQMHSDWSDGNETIEALAKYVLANYPYDYIVLTDHSKTERVAGGMKEKDFLRQLKSIASVNKKIKRNFIKTGAEVDILADGKLDLTDELLQQLDWVCASIHTSMNRDNTERLIAACHHPFVTCIGHPSGRIIGKREPYPVDWKQVFRAAAESGTALEINAQPGRMDLNGDLAWQARESGVALVISTDSHAQNNFAFMEIGVAIARRAWCTADDILNTRPWKDLEAFRDKKRKGGISKRKK